MKSTLAARSVGLLRTTAILIVTATVAIAGGMAHAQGVTDKEIIIGQTAGFTGSLAGIVAELTQGAKLYLDSVNESGGVNGRKITLESLDDGSVDPKRAGANAQKLVTEKAPLAFSRSAISLRNASIFLGAFWQAARFRDAAYASASNFCLCGKFGITPICCANATDC